VRGAADGASLRHEDAAGLGPQLEQLRIGHLGTEEGARAPVLPSHAKDRHQVAVLERELGSDLDQGPVAPEPRHQAAASLEELRLRNRPAGEGVLLDPIDSNQRKRLAPPTSSVGVPGRTEVSQASELRRLLAQIDSQQARQQPDQECHPRETVDVGDGVGDGQVVQRHLVREVGRQIGHSGGDGVLRGHEGGGARQRAGEHARRVAGLEAEVEGQESHRGDRRRGHEEREQQELPPLLSEGAEELRARLEADAVDEQDEPDRLGLRRDRELLAAEEQPHQQHAGGGAELKAEELEVADQITNAQDEEEGEGGLRRQAGQQARDHGGPYATAFAAIWQGRTGGGDVSEASRGG